MYRKIGAQYDGRGKSFLVVGCGNQADHLARHFSGDTLFVFTDIDKGADADIFCDSHELPFRDNVFDGIISTAVMEHVLYPEKVTAEFWRVLNKTGIVYSEIPFLQSVHEGAYDFTRYSLSGHRRLMENFSETESGMIAGPGTATVWTLCGLFSSLSSHPRISSLLRIAARLSFFWIKYIDHLVKNNPAALDHASATYFYGRRSDSKASSIKIIHAHHSTFKHT